MCLPMLDLDQVFPVGFGASSEMVMLAACCHDGQISSIDHCFFVPDLK